MGEKNNINVKIENHGVIPKEEEHRRNCIADL